MSDITVNRATLARRVNNEIEYIYPKTYAELVEYDDTQSVKEKIDSLESGGIDVESKVNKPVDNNGNFTNGTEGQVLKSNGDGTTFWDDSVDIELDETLNVKGLAADSKTVGDAIDSLTVTVNSNMAAVNISIDTINDSIDTVNSSVDTINNNIDIINDNIDTVNDNMLKKLNKPVDNHGNITDGEAKQMLVSNGDGSTSWELAGAKVYVGSDEMPEGYDIQIDPEGDAIIVDRTLSVDGGIAEASATGAAINAAKNKITSDIKSHNEDAASHLDIRAMITDAKEFILLKDISTGEEFKVYVEDGVLKINSTVPKPVSITMTKAPNKTSYHVGDAFDPTGMVVKVTYTDGTTKEVTGYTYPTTKITSDTTTVMITYIEAGITVTTNVNISVIVECIGISVTTAPTKTSYYIGDTFSNAGMVVAATYTDGTVKVVTNYTHPTTALTSGTSSITVTYTEDGKSFTAIVPITVSAKYTGLSVTTNPTKTSYYIGDTFNPAGMVVKANYNDGTSKTVTGYTYSTSALTSGVTSVAISYTENGLTYTTTVPVTVSAKYSGLSVVTAPTKTTYISGETFKPAGMVVKASYNDGTTKTVTNYTYPTTGLVLGATSVTISYTENGTTYTATVPVTVINASLLQDFTYQDNGNGTYTLTGWKGTKNGVASTELVVPDHSSIIVDPSGV